VLLRSVTTSSLLFCHLPFFDPAICYPPSQPKIRYTTKRCTSPACIFHVFLESSVLNVFRSPSPYPTVGCNVRSFPQLSRASRDRTTDGTAPFSVGLCGWGPWSQWSSFRLIARGVLDDEPFRQPQGDYAVGSEISEHTSTATPPVTSVVTSSMMERTTDEGTHTKWLTKRSPRLDVTRSVGRSLITPKCDRLATLVRLSARVAWLTGLPMFLLHVYASVRVGTLLCSFLQEVIHFGVEAVTPGHARSQWRRSWFWTKAMRFWGNPSLVQFLIDRHGKGWY
jgi:hypothetical protein